MDPPMLGWQASRNYPIDYTQMAIEEGYDITYEEHLQIFSESITPIHYSGKAPPPGYSFPDLRLRDVEAAENSESPENNESSPKNNESSPKNNESSPKNNESSLENNESSSEKNKSSLENKKSSTENKKSSPKDTKDSSENQRDPESEPRKSSGSDANTESSPFQHSLSGQCSSKPRAIHRKPSSSPTGSPINKLKRKQEATPTCISSGAIQEPANEPDEEPEVGSELESEDDLEGDPDYEDEPKAGSTKKLPNGKKRRLSKKV